MLRGNTVSPFAFLNIADVMPTSRNETDSFTIETRFQKDRLLIVRLQKTMTSYVWHNEKIFLSFGDGVVVMVVLILCSTVQWVNVSIFW